MTGFPNTAAWRDPCAADAVLGTWAGPWGACFAVTLGNDTTIFNFIEGQIAGDPGIPAFTLAAPEATWARFLEPVPPRHHHRIFAEMYRLPEFSIQGDQLAFMQHAHVARRVLEVGKWLALGRTLPVPVSLHPREGARAVPAVTGRYVPVTVGGVTYQIYSESAGSGQDVLCMHTAGADGRQIPWSDGRSAHLRTSPAGVVRPALAWQIAAAGGRDPGLVAAQYRPVRRAHYGLCRRRGAGKTGGPGGVDVGGDLPGTAYRHPEAFAGIIACEACDKINQRQTIWAAHLSVNQAQFVP